MQLPAQTATHQNLAFIRQVLVHEFAHDFYNIQELWKLNKSGDLPEVLESHHDDDDPEVDKALMVTPEDWFGAEDSKNFLYRGAAPLKPNIHLAELRKKLPVLLPARGFYAEGPFAFSEEIDAHLNKLNNSQLKPNVAEE